MARRWLIGGLAVLLVAGGTGWMFRKEIILNILTTLAKAQDVRARGPIGPTQEIRWQQGPDFVSEGGERPPNIILIIADDLGMNDISTFGGGIVKTPNIDRLASQGASFNQAYSGHNSCAPSRAMLMTGRYPTRTGFYFTPIPDNMGRMVKLFSDGAGGGLPEVVFTPPGKDTPTFEQQGLPGSEVTVAEVLKAKGYHTVHIGKWHTGIGKEFGANAQGFDESLLMASGLHLPVDDPNVVNARLPFDPIDRFLWARMEFSTSYNGGKLFKPGGYLSDYWTDESIKVIKANKNRPFFLKLAHWGIHTPLQATKADYDAVGDLKPERLRVYAAMTRALDRSVGRILDALDAEGMAENTVVVFTSDNGGAGYIGIPGVNAPYRGWKLTNFEGGIRVPMFVKWPGKIPAGAKIEAPVAHIDVMPTVAAAAQADLPKGVAIDGVNLLPFAEGKAPANRRPHEALFWEAGYYQAVRAGDWKLQVSTNPKKEWLYNLAVDPTEKRNLAAENPAKLAELRAMLVEHHKDARPPLYPYSIEAPVAVDKTLAEAFVPGDEFIYNPN